MKTSPLGTPLRWLPAENRKRFSVSAVCREKCICITQRFIYLTQRVCVRYKNCFKLAGTEIVALIQHEMKIFPKSCGIRLFGISIVPHRFRCEIQAGQRTDTVDDAVAVVPANNVFQTAAKPVGQEAYLMINFRMCLQIPQLCQTGTHCHRIAAERTRLIDRAQRSHQLHDLPSAAVCTDRHAAADDLAIGHQIRFDTKVSDSTVQLQTKSGNDFVQNQQSTVLVTDLTDSLQESLFRNHNAHIGSHRFHRSL